MAAGRLHVRSTRGCGHRRGYAPNSERAVPAITPGSLTHPVAQKFSVYHRFDFLCRGNVCFTTRQIAGLRFRKTSPVKCAGKARIRAECCVEIFDSAIKLAQLQMDQSARVERCGFLGPYGERFVAVFERLAQLTCNGSRPA